MKLILKINFLLVAILIACNTNNKPETENFIKVFSGTIDNKYDILLKIEKNGDSLDGEYYYTKYRLPIPLKGTIKDNHVVLSEFDKNGNATGTFNGQMNGSVIEGNWSKPNGQKRMIFTIKETTTEYSVKSETKKEHATNKPSIVTKDGITVKQIILADIKKNFTNYGEAQDTAYVQVCYPEISGLANKNIQDKINNSLKLTKQDIAEDIKNADDGFSVESGFNVTLLTKKIISISFGGTSWGGAHPFYAAYMDNKTIDLQSGQTITFSDIVPSDKRDSFTKLLNGLAKQDELLKDLGPMTVNSKTRFYLTDNGLVIELFQDVNFQQWISATGYPQDLIVPYDKLKDINADFLSKYELGN